MRTASTKGAGPPTSYKHPEGTFWVSPPPVRHTATVLKKRKTETAKALMPRDLNAEVMQVDDSGSSSSEEVSPEPAGKNKIVNVQALKQMDEIIDILSYQSIGGEGGVYLVRLDDGRRVRVDEDALIDYPDLVEDFERRQGGGGAAGGKIPSSDGVEEAIVVDSGSDGDGGAYEDEGAAMSEDERDEDIRNFIAGDDEDEDEAPRRKKRGGKARKSAAAQEETRRSSRATRHQETFDNEEDMLTESKEEDLSSEEEPLSSSRSALKPPKQVKPRGSIQVIDLGSEDESQFDAKARHVPWCEKCEGGPADLLLRQHKGHKKRKSGKARKRGASTETETEHEIKQRGAWIECGTCVVSYHFDCLPKLLQADISRSTKAEAMEVDGGKAAKRELDIAARLAVPQCPLCAKANGTFCVGSPCQDLNRADDERLFRCWKCKRAAHWGCLPYDPPEYQSRWECDDCHRWGEFAVDVILAWRIPGTKEGDATPLEWKMPSVKDPEANAEYLVRFQGVSYRQVEWLPHVYLAATCAARLRNFLDKGPTVTMSAQPSPVTPGATEDGEIDVDITPDFSNFGIEPNPSAQRKIPSDWTSIDRILDVRYSDGQGGDGWVDSDKVRFKVRPEEAPYLSRANECLFKWKSLSYGDATWDTPPKQGDADYDEYKAAYIRWVRAQQVTLPPKLSAKDIEKLNQPRSIASFPGFKEQPAFITGGELKPFQVDGVGWLFFNWWQKNNVILADEMGLGKTVQIIAFLSVLFQSERAMPFLCVVPQSTHANWMREFAKWAPRMVVVPYLGDASSRQMISKHELYSPSGNLRAHCIVTTYEHVTSSSALFVRVPRFDVMIVDEGQRLKGGDSGKLFKALNRISVGHKIILSGTPINNNLDELFALLNFLDPKQFNDLAGYKKRFETLDSELVQEVQNMLKPRFLRRVKERVLDLPPLHSIIVPMSLRPLQKRVYKDILSRNIDSISSLFQPAKGAKGGNKMRKSFNNILMELRKTCAHPYLVSSDIEPQGVTSARAHANLVDASEKFRVLQMMLPKLKQRGHRVLLFSQFIIVLDVIERFLEGEGIKFVRLDGGSSSSERQSGIDAFNREGTVILFDPDWNPFQDLQAISRAHRIGQTKPVTCYKLMVKGSCEEKMIAVGKKKMVLEHLIVERIDHEVTDDTPDDVESFLQYGAKEIFEQGENEAESDIRYKVEDIDALLDRSEAEMPKRADGEQAQQQVLAYARVWEREKNGLAELEPQEESATIEEQRGFWAQLLDEKVALEEQERLKRAAQLGRGRRERKQLQALHFSGFESDQESPKQAKAPQQGVQSDDEDYEANNGHHSSDAGSDDDASEPSAALIAEDRDILKDPNAPPEKKRQRAKKHRPPQIPGAAVSSRPASPRTAQVMSQYPDLYAHSSYATWNNFDAQGWPIATGADVDAYRMQVAAWAQQQRLDQQQRYEERQRHEHQAKRLKQSLPSPRAPEAGPSTLPRSAVPSASASARPAPSPASFQLRATPPAPPPQPTNENATAQQQAALNQARRDQMIRQLADKAARLNNQAVNDLLAAAVCRQGKEQTRMLVEVTRLMREETARRNGGGVLRPHATPV